MLAAALIQGRRSPARHEPVCPVEFITDFLLKRFHRRNYSRQRQRRTESVHTRVRDTSNEKQPADQ